MKIFNSYAVLFAVLVALKRGIVVGRRIGERETLSSKQRNKISGIINSKEGKAKNLKRKQQERNLQVQFQFLVSLDGVVFYIPGIIDFRFSTGWNENVVPLLSNFPPTITFDPTALFSSSCFSSHTTADVSGKGEVSMSEVEVGDQVLTSKGKYETVYAIDHRHTTKTMQFVQIHTKEEEGEEKLRTPLELTTKHMVYLYGLIHPVPASTIKVDDQLQTLHGPRKVTKIEIISRQGIYNPLTTDGTIVASGIISSTYSALFSNNEYIEIAPGRQSYKLMSHQRFFHTVLKPYQYICSQISFELCKTDQERIPIAQIAVNLYSNHWLRQEKNQMHQTIFVCLVLLLACTLEILTNPYFFISSGLMVAVVLNFKTKKITKMKRA